jgi:hypothetical protein
MLLHAPQGDQPLTILPSDLAVLEAGDERKDLPCNLTAQKPELGFDLRFHTGYQVTVPLRELSGEGDLLTIVFRVYPDGAKNNPSFFVQHFTVPEIEEDAKGDTILDGIVDVGEGSYHVDWLMRDRSERFCSSSWDFDARLSAKDKPMSLFINTREISQVRAQPFVNGPLARVETARPEGLNLKILVNFAPQLQGAAAMRRTDVDALVTILKEIERDPNVTKISLVAFNINETRVVYRQETADRIDYPALGKALESMKLGTVKVQNLAKNSDTDFLENLIQTEMGGASHPDAVIFAGPKAMLNGDVPQDDLRRIGDIECPVFYLNYNLDPQAMPWKDSISRAIRVFRGIEFTISHPRDVWFSTTEMLGRIRRYKHDRVLATAAVQPTSRAANGLVR